MIFCERFQLPVHNTLAPLHRCALRFGHDLSSQIDLLKDLGIILEAMVVESRASLHPAGVMVCFLLLGLILGYQTPTHDLLET